MAYKANTKSQIACLFHWKPTNLCLRKIRPHSTSNLFSSDKKVLLCLNYRVLTSLCYPTFSEFCMLVILLTRVKQ